MRELPILCKDSVAMNIRDGRQTQHRVPMKKQRDGVSEIGFVHDRGICAINGSVIYEYAPWSVGDMLYIREACKCDIEEFPDDPGTHGITYRADDAFAELGEIDINHQEVYDRFHDRKGWTGSQLMPKFAARTWVKVSRVWCERIQSISEEDCRYEGCDTSDWVDQKFIPEPEAGHGQIFESLYKPSFFNLWDSIYGKPKDGKPDYSWNANPYVWCCEFERIER